MTGGTVALDHLEPVAVAELKAAADLQTRTDRKYVLTPDQFVRLLDELGDQVRVLDVEGHRSFDYESVYFDTPAFDSYLGAAYRRPDRFKVRTRSYLGIDQSWIEVKLRNRRGQTVKHRERHDFDHRRELVAPSRSFVESFPALRQFGCELQPVLGTHYRRSTLIVGETRITLDSKVSCTAARSAPPIDGRAVTESVWAHLGEQLILETKNERSAGEIDRALWSLQLRPIPLSKFAIGMAALHPDLPANKWHRTLRRHITIVRSPSDRPSMTFDEGSKQAPS